MNKENQDSIQLVKEANLKDSEAVIIDNTRLQSGEKAREMMGLLESATEVMNKEAKAKTTESESSKQTDAPPGKEDNHPTMSAENNRTDKIMLHTSEPNFATFLNESNEKKDVLLSGSEEKHLRKDIVQH